MELNKQPATATRLYSNTFWWHKHPFLHLCLAATLTVGIIGSFLLIAYGSFISKFSASTANLLFIGCMVFCVCIFVAVFAYGGNGKTEIKQPSKNN